MEEYVELIDTVVAVGGKEEEEEEGWLACRLCDVVLLVLLLLLLFCCCCCVDDGKVTPPLAFVCEDRLVEPLTLSRIFTIVVPNSWASGFDKKFRPYTDV